MRIFIMLSLALYTAGAGFAAHAENKSMDENTATGMRVHTCNAGIGKDQANDVRNASRKSCEPIPVALDLRFMDDDYARSTYDLPVALDLDWESGEP